MQAQNCVSNMSLEDIAIQVVQQLSSLGLEFFKKKLPIEIKRDRTLVSDADRAIEAKARELFAALTPDFGFMGEEFGGIKKLGSVVSQKLENGAEGDSLNAANLHAFESNLNHFVEDQLNLNTDTYWVLDPIDGTVNFLAKSPTWSILIALVQNGEPIVGIVALPALNEVFVASKNRGARWGQLDQNKSTFRACELREPRTLSHAHISCSTPKVFANRGIEGWYTALLADSFEFRTHSDAYGYTRILLGGIDAMIDPLVASYDVAALQILFDETPGAHFTTLHGHVGKSRFRKGSAVAAANEKLAMEILHHYHSFLTHSSQKNRFSPGLTAHKERLFKENYVLTAEAHPFSNNQPDSQGWLLAMEAGVALFRQSNSIGSQQVNIEDLSVLIESNESVVFVVKNGMLDTCPHVNHLQGIQIRAVVAGGVGLVTSVLPVSGHPSGLVFQTLEMAFAQSQEQKCNSQTEILAARDQVIGHFGNSDGGAKAGGANFLTQSVDDLIEVIKKQQKENQLPEVQSNETRTDFNAENRLQLFLDGSQQTITRMSTRISVNSTATKGEEKRRGNHRTHENLNSSVKSISDEHLFALAAAQKNAVDLLGAEYVPENIDYDFLAIDADLLGLILHEAVGHAAEGDLVETGASGFGKNGKMEAIRVAPPWIDIVIDGTLNNCGLSLVDAEGTLAVRKTIVRKGILVEGIHTRQTALSAGQIPDGSARMESIFHPSLNRMTSIWVQALSSFPLHASTPGETLAQPSAETLMNALEKTDFLSGEHGVLFLSGWKGGTATCSNLEFRADVARIYRLKKGKKPELMREANFTGIATECFKSAVAAFGPVLCRSIGSCGKDGQSVPTSDGGPALMLFKKDPHVRVIGSGEAMPE